MKKFSDFFSEAINATQTSQGVNLKSSASIYLELDLFASSSDSDKEINTSFTSLLLISGWSRENVWPTCIPGLHQRRYVGNVSLVSPVWVCKATQAVAVADKNKHLLKLQPAFWGCHIRTILLKSRGRRRLLWRLSTRFYSFYHLLIRNHSLSKKSWFWPRPKPSVQPCYVNVFLAEMNQSISKPGFGRGLK